MCQVQSNLKISLFHGKANLRKEKRKRGEKLQVEVCKFSCLGMWEGFNTLSIPRPSRSIQDT